MNAVERAFADADRSLIACKAASISTVVAASAGYVSRPPSLMAAQEQLLHLRSWTWAAIRLVAQRIAGQRLCVGYASAGQRYKSSIGQPIEPLASHPILSGAGAPNPWWTYWQHMFVTICSLEVTGRALWWVRKEADATGVLFIPTPWIYEIHPLREWYKIRPLYSAGEEFVIPGDEVVDLHYPLPDGLMPTEVLSPLARVSESVLTDQQIQTAQHAAFKNGIYPSVILTAGRLPDVNGIPGQRPTLTAQQCADLIAAIRAAYAGVTSAGEPLIIDAMIEKVEKFSQSVMEMNFSDSSKIVKSRVLQAFGVSPILMGELEGANRASSVVADEIFVANKVNPLIELLSGALTQFLCPMFSGPRRQRLVCWIEHAKPHDAETRLKEWDLGSRMGFVTRNEYRVNVLNLAAVTGGDEFLTPAAFLPSDEQADDDGNDDQSDDKRAKRNRRKSDDDDDDEIEDDVERGICPECGGRLDSDGVCEECGEDWSDYKSHANNNGHRRITITR